VRLRFRAAINHMLEQEWLAYWRKEPRSAQAYGVNKTMQNITVIVITIAINTTVQPGPCCCGSNGA